MAATAQQQPLQLQPASLEWPRRFLEAHLDEVAITTVPLVLHPRTWIERRREYVEFLDEETVRREVRIDFSVPKQRRPLEVTQDKPVFYAPLALIKKGSLRQLRVDDGGGTELAPVNRGDAGRIAHRMLYLAAHGVLGAPPTKDLAEKLKGIAFSDAAIAEKILRKLGRLKGMSAMQAVVLLMNIRFRILLVDLAYNSLFIVPLLGGKPHARACVRYTYEECLPRSSRPRRERLAESVTWNAFDIPFDTPALGSAMSCDIDIKAPDELRIESARIVEASAKRKVLDTDKEPSRIAHLRVHGRPRGTDGVVQIGLRLRSGGFLGSCVIAAALTFLVLLLGVVRADAVGGAEESAAALLVGLPALLAGYLVRPGEHRLVGRVVTGVRLLLVILILLCVVAIGTLIGGAGQTVQQVVWGVLACAAFLILAVTVAAWLRAHKLER